MIETTLDGILNHQLMLEQPRQGYRIAVDTVLLAAAVPARAGQIVLDIGCGVGGAMLCLACRVPDCHVTGIEIQSDLAELGRRNIERNNMRDRADIIQNDVAEFNQADNFDHVLMNPPYHEEARHDVSEQSAKRIANSSKEGDLAVWIDRAAIALKSDGMLTLIHRADRLAEIVVLVKPHFGAIEVLPIVPRADAPPKRIILRAKKGASVSFQTMKPFVLHKMGGGYTDEAEKILRQAAELAWEPISC